MDGCIMCENTLTAAASQKMLLQLEEVFQVNIVANVRHALFMCSRCEVNVHFIEGAMKLKKEMEEHLLESLDIVRSGASAGNVHSSAGDVLRPKRRRRETDDGLDSNDQAARHLYEEDRGYENENRVLAHRRPPGSGISATGSLYGGQTSNDYESMGPISYVLKSSAPPGQQGRGSNLHAVARTDLGMATPSDIVGDRRERASAGDARLMAQKDTPGGGASSMERNSHTMSTSQLQSSAATGQHSPSVTSFMSHGSRRRRGYPCGQCGKVLRTRSWLTRHLQSCGSDSSNQADMEGVLSDGSYSEDDADGDKDVSLHADVTASTPTSTPPAGICACKDCGKTFKRKTWLLKHSLQCVASRITPTSAPTSTGLSSGLAPQVGSALTCCHCGKRYLGRYDKYREHVKQCGLRANGGVAQPTAEGTCTKCGDAIAGTVEDYEKHLAGCNGQASADTAVHTCPNCGRCYAKRYDYFLRHVRSCRRADSNLSEPQALADGEPCVCPRCSKMYRRSDHLWQHMEMCRGMPGRNVGPHVCDKCGKTYGTRYDVLQRHVLTCKGVQLDNDRSAAASRSAGAHPESMGDSAVEHSVHDPMGNASALDDDMQNEESGFEGDHSVHRASGIGPNECLKCGKVYTMRYDQFARHVQKCRGIPVAAPSEAGPYVCPRCNKEYGKRYELYLRHVENCGINTAKAGQHVCPKCGDASEKYEDLWAHMQICEGNSVEGGGLSGQDEDESMGQVGSDLSGLKSSGKMRNMCSKCGKSYVLLTCFRKHVAKCMVAPGGTGGDIANGSVYNGIRRREMFNNSGSASPSHNSHLDDDDNDDDDGGDADDDAEGMPAGGGYECDTCGRSFGSRRASFLKHVAMCGGSSSFHGSSSGLHVCEYCGKHFVRLGNYTRHLQMCQYSTTSGVTDSGLRPLRQRQCDKCMEMVAADQFISHAEHCYGGGLGSLVLPEGMQLVSSNHSDKNADEDLAVANGSGASSAALSLQQLNPTTWTCPRCKKEFQQSGQYIRHISTCSMEFLKCPKCDFGRYYSDRKDFDNHVASCRGKALASTGVFSSTANAAPSPLPMTASDQSFAADSNATSVATGNQLASRSAALPHDAAFPVPLSGGQPVSSVGLSSDASESALGDVLDGLGSSEFALHEEEVIAAGEGEADVATSASGHEAAAVYEETVVLYM